MCLSIIKREIKNPTQKQYAAWKVFDWTGQDLGFPFQCGIVAEGEWMKARPVSVQTEKNPRLQYNAGFHVYCTRRDATAASGKISPITPWEIRVLRVAVRGITYVGEQDGYSVLVAREMYVKRDGV